MTKYFITNQKALYSYTSYELAELTDIRDFLIKCKENNLVVNVDIETNGLDPLIQDVLLVQVGNKALDSRYIIDLTTISKKAVTEAIKLLEEIECNIHNAKFEYKFLKHRLNITLEKVYCTMLAEQVLKNNLPETRITKKGESGYYSLEKTCLRYTGIQLDKSLQKSFIGKVNSIPFTEAQLDYALDDILYLEDIRTEQEKLAKQWELEQCIKLENKVVLAYGDIELNGMPYNEFMWYDIYLDNKPKLDKAIENLDDFLIANINTFPQLSKYLDNQMDLFNGSEGRKVKINWGSEKQVIPVFQIIEPTLSLVTYDGKVSIGKEQIKQYKNKSEFVRLLLDFSLYDKAVNTYGLKWAEEHQHSVTKRVHPEFNQLGTITGRVSCEKPNLQQIPSSEKYRKSFMCDEGWKMISIDYSQAEQRIAANNSKDPILLDVFIQGKDPYCVAGEIMFKVPVSKTVNSDKRKVAKAVVLGKNFGIGGAKLAKKIREEGIECEDHQGKEIVNLFDSSFPTLTSFNKKQNLFAQKNRYAVTLDIFKRRCWFDRNPNIDGNILAKIGRNGQNMNCQGGNANLTKLAVIFIRNYFKELNSDGIKAKLVNTIHDEVLAEVKEEHAETVAKKMQELMIKAGTYICKHVTMDATYVIDDCWVKD